eukprot:scaffold279011_cov28-Tisochrysis_lutea.AAC.5
MVDFVVLPGSVLVSTSARTRRATDSLSTPASYRALMHLPMGAAGRTSSCPRASCWSSSSASPTCPPRARSSAAASSAAARRVEKCSRKYSESVGRTS